MADEMAVCKDNCYDSNAGTYYKAGVAYPVDIRNPFIQRHFTIEPKIVDKALERAEKAKK